jgi:hypothetical protein
LAVDLQSTYHRESIRRGEMRRPPSQVRASTAVRGIFGTATILTFLVALLARDDPRWFVISGTCATIWWAWDLLMEYVFVPIGDWLMLVLTGGELTSPPPGARPTMEDTIRLLESHLERGASRHVDINAALRLEEIYRTVKHDAESAKRVVEVALERYPDAKELDRFRSEMVGDGEGR